LTERLKNQTAADAASNSAAITAKAFDVDEPEPVFGN
jgi:hypothetical protein